ncbi:hypothetical protein GMORB2_7339 [Geosmithia morbida]|uniref:Uncharacterized protein n=1 Tax=Geosmithia morbida TaxID=1094350 RepID=A0A9P4YV26_9HYPO|nr:uncharacterized protein GMORB2_7339 [Geosmithia morbida]KAF4122347.1 hypothetical protein GMORB2_7339 [Geosmithia morbida]
MRDVIEAQWTVIKIAAPSGAAEDPGKLYQSLPPMPPVTYPLYEALEAQYEASKGPGDTSLLPGG